MAIVTDETLLNPQDQFRFSAARAKPVGEPHGGVVVIQEVFGVSEHIREIASFFADNGYEALAPSLFDRIEPGFSADMQPDNLQRAMAAVAASPAPQVAGDLQTTIDALGPGPVYVTGFCYGGAMTWMATQRCRGVTAAAAFYGGMITRFLSEKPRAPIILHYGAHDAHIPESEIDKVRAFAPDVPVYMYEAGHGFCRKGSSDFHQPSRDLALQRTLEFFAQHR